MKNFFKILLFSSLILSSMITLSSYTWIGIWMGLEINLISMVPMMQKKSNILSTESSIKYFIVQVMASSVLAMSIILMMIKMGSSSNTEKTTLQLMLNSSLLMKMGMPPFHFWFPEVMEGLSWSNCMIMLTWQKLAPMTIVMYNMTFYLLTSSIIIAGLLISSAMIINQTSLRKLMTYSSINHLSWMMTSMMMNQTIWLFYFSVYSILTINLLWTMNKEMPSNLSQMNTLISNNPKTKMMFLLNLMNFGGIPPLLGFMPKWMIIEISIKNKMFMLTTTILITTLIIILTYIKMSMSFLVMSTNLMNWSMNLKQKYPSSGSIINFINLASLITITLTFNYL